jgi:hypothetical protein
MPNNRETKIDLNDLSYLLKTLRSLETELGTNYKNLCNELNALIPDHWSDNKATEFLTIQNDYNELLELICVTINNDIESLDNNWGGLITAYEQLNSQ